MSFRMIAALGVATMAAACATGGRSGSEDRAAPIREVLSADAMLFVSFDDDHDHSVTSAEVDAGLNREFARADASGDGALQPIEFQNWGNTALGGGYLGPFRLDFDRNVDNTITRAEFDTEIRARVVTYDVNEDGVLVRSEFVRRIGQTHPVQPQRTYGTPGNR